ncbi:tyrosine-type recombinase/integrase [Aureimonas phyllosphaerae]|uniref:Integrase n=1 Tax=Aureimonas phyllosphaerae TaxID=1166078 RepID=A0A7W6FSL3_9HYPH|nr:site-specific integrase [Aureimonas phyllosphaerae]MBB3934274.1 integrase [Aureimonas phyllosphaerae]MBB3958510.1 integrase [Aureimonas phyllosphaerae]SFE98140.1 Site-specific recombinase XerD [Aureimonas phyllosphaerae]
MSVRKRKWTNADGTTGSGWQVDYRDAAGTRRSKSFKLKRDADVFANTTAVELKDGTHVPDAATVTVAEAADLWLKSCRDAGLEQSTIKQYGEHVRLHLVPFIGATKLTKISVPGVRAFQEKLREADRSSAMIKRVTVSLGSILSDSQERGLVVRNAVSEMAKRRGSAKSKVEKRQRGRLRYGIDIPTMDEARALIAAAEGRHRAFILTMVFTGMRSSELRGLSWPDVDLRKGLLHVRQRADAFQDIGMPKSDAGQRTIPLLPLVVEALTEWKAECPKGELGLVFPTETGRPQYHANIVSRIVQPLVVKAGLTIDTGRIDADGQPILEPRYSGMHAWRHWNASWLLNAREVGGLGLPPKAVQARLGHSSIQMTYDTYGHLWPTNDEASAMAEAQALFLGATVMQQNDVEARKI